MVGFPQEPLVSHYPRVTCAPLFHLIRAATESKHTQLSSDVDPLGRVLLSREKLTYKAARGQVNPLWVEEFHKLCLSDPSLPSTVRPLPLSLSVTLSPPPPSLPPPSSLPPPRCVSPLHRPQLQVQTAYCSMLGHVAQEHLLNEHLSHLLSWRRSLADVRAEVRGSVEVCLLPHSVSVSLSLSRSLTLSLSLCSSLAPVRCLCLSVPLSLSCSLSSDNTRTRARRCCCPGVHLRHARPHSVHLHLRCVDTHTREM